MLTKDNSNLSENQLSFLLGEECNLIDKFTMDQQYRMEPYLILFLILGSSFQPLNPSFPPFKPFFKISLKLWILLWFYHKRCFFLYQFCSAHSKIYLHSFQYLC